MSDLKLCYNILTQVYKQQAYGAISLNKYIDSAHNRDFVTRLVYGVLQFNVRYDYYIGAMTAKKPQNSAVILLKIGMYCIEEMDSMPDYAAVNNTVNLTKEIGKQGSAGFINGVLKAFCKQKPAMPKDVAAKLSVEASVPLWIVKQYIKQYGFEKTQAFLLAHPCEEEHLRVNTLKITADEMVKKLEQLKVNFRKDENCKDCFFVNNSPVLKPLFEQGEFTFQSFTSVKCCEIAMVEDGDKVLDMCAAPGGKSVYFASCAKDVSVLSCDVYHHRLQLIQQYAKRMGVKLDVRLLDATVFNPSLKSSFDKVLCDVPCSGFGVAAKKPDVYLFREKDAIFGLTQTQYKILENGAKYVKEGGVLVYSTCTLLRDENEDIVKRFLKQNRHFKLLMQQQFFPDGKGTDGFFVAKMQRTRL